MLLYNVDISSKDIILTRETIMTTIIITIATVQVFTFLAMNIIFFILDK